MENFLNVTRNYFYRFAAIMSLLVASLLICDFSIANDEIDDVEAGMESVLSESEAAQSAATAAKQVEKQEKSDTAKAKTEATKAIGRAKAKEAEATAVIKKMEAKITQHKKERTAHDAAKADAEKKIVMHQERITKKTAELEAAKSVRDTAKAEKEAQQKILADLASEEKKLIEKIQDERKDTAKFKKETNQINADARKKEKSLVQLRKSAEQEEAKKVAAKKVRDTATAKNEAVPTKVVMRTAARNCPVHEFADGSSKSVGEVKKGQSYELYRVVEKTWVDMRSGKTRGFVERTCFSR